MTSAPDRIESWHLSEPVRAEVEAWFHGDRKPLELDGERSVMIAHPHDKRLRLKIKGAGLLGGPVQFGVFHNTGPKAPLFDFEGRMMEDVAIGHDNAPEGGASFQQVVNEHRISGFLNRRGYRAVPSLGYGRLTKGPHHSWFVVMEMRKGWELKRHLPWNDFDHYREVTITCAEKILDVAVTLDLLGQFAYLSAPKRGNYIIKDVHPLIRANPINMSQLSWVMQLAFGLHLRTNIAIMQTRKAKREDLVGEMSVLPLQTADKAITQADRQAFIDEVVTPYMLGPPQGFSPDRLRDTLMKNRFTRALMHLCPPKYTRY